MFKKVLRPVVLTSLLAVSAMANAENSSIESLVAATVSNTVASVKEDIQYKLQTAILDVTYVVETQEEGVYATKVVIRDLAKADTSTKTDKAE